MPIEHIHIEGTGNEVILKLRKTLKLGVEYVVDVMGKKEVGQNTKNSLKQISDIIPSMKKINDSITDSEDQIRNIKSSRTTSPLKTV
ncbi:hypothetical protein HON22_05240 [Candidatus Peregrinibacteria bacterium]|mgnify:CR=1 FL=1|jgi:hypothetical protein|nr:hypothetical protein [Candidatus Peregrinibacteria bacterium]